MSQKLQAVRGMNDVLPSQIAVWQYLESQLINLLNSYAYQEIRFPIVESTQLFKRSIGEVTDIVEKEMYTFDDRNGDSLTLRPEGTAACIRAAIQHGLLPNLQQRLWYMGPMFRHERPQKGRYRQFYQLGVETLGMPGPDIDAELILLTARFWHTLGLSTHLELQLNSLGTPASREVYRKALVAYFEANQADLDEDSQRRLSSNPMRILDSKNPDMKALITQAPSLIDYLDESSKQHFDQLLALLDKAGIVYTVNPRLVRGLDYYTHTVFEWVTSELGAQGTVCAGGRFDGLVEQLGGRATPASGFAMGLERLVLLHQQVHGDYQAESIHAYLITVGDAAQLEGLAFAEKLRNEIPSLRLQTHCGGGSFKSQFKKADKSQATLALIMGDDEIANHQIGVKFLREDKAQQTLAWQALPEFLQHYFRF